jgi:folate-binding protein YgfZ
MLAVPSQEYAAARSAVARLGLPWRALVSIRGADAGTFLQGMLTQNLDGMKPGDVLRTCLVDRRAHLVADGWIRRDEDGFELIVPEAQRAEVAATLDRHLIREQVEILPARGAQVLLVCGPEAPATLERCGLRAGAWPVAETFDAPGADFLLVAGGEEEAHGIGERLGRVVVAEISEPTFERLRIEAGHARWGFDMGPEHFPMEVRLEAALSYEKGCYLGQETIARAHYRGHMNRGLMGVRFPPGAPPPSAGALLLHGEEEIGRITSVSPGPEGGDLLALGMVGRAHQIAAASVSARGRAGRLEPLPFRESHLG